MKKLIFIVCAIFMALSASAQMKIVENSFIDYSAGNKAAGQGTMGLTDMTSQSIDWPQDADGNDEAALLYVFFENMAPADIEKVKPSLSDGNIVIKTDYPILKERKCARIFVPVVDNVDVDFAHDKFGTVRLPRRSFKNHNIYQVTVRNSTTVPVTITSIPEGATVTFDSKQVGTTPLTLPDVMMGAHNVAFTPVNPDVAMSMPERTYDISSTNATISVDLRKRKTVTITAKPSDASITVISNGKEIDRGVGVVVLKDVPYETAYKVTAEYRDATLIDDIVITPELAENLTMNVIGSRSVSFFAKQNNEVVRGAQVTLNGQTIGSTPFNKVLEYGSYKVEMAYSGYHKSKTLKVNKNTTECYIKLPNKKRGSFNPFDIDYNKRQWGLGASYINRYYTHKVDGRSKKYKWNGEPGTSSGMQLGLTYQPYFGYGQGLSTGVYWQATFGHIEDGSKELSTTEHALYVPLQYQFRLPLHENFSIAVNFGAALTYGLSNNIDGDTKSGKESIDMGYGYNSTYGYYFPEALDYSLLMGAAIQFKALQLEAKYSLGLKDHKIGNVSDGTYKSGFYSLGLSLLF